MEEKAPQVETKKNGKSKFKTWVIIPMCFVIIAAAGVTTGIILKRQFGQTEIDYSGFNPENFRMDGKALLKEYQKNPKKNFTEAELVNIGLEKYRECDNCWSIGIGVADTIVNQTIRNGQIKQGDHYFEESISYSKMVSVANRVDQVGIDTNISLNKGKANGTEDVTYKKDVTTYKAEDYKKTWGKTLDEMFIYLISNETVLKEGSKIEKSDDTIKVTVNLDTDISSYYYKVQMKEISDLDKLPVFEYLVHTYTFSKDMTLLHCKVDEKYQASMGVTATIHNTIDYYYHANEKRNIPNENETVDYSIEGENQYE